MRPRWTAVALCLAIPVACSRSPGPSAEYVTARQKHAALVASHPGDAALQPGISEVLDLLARVPEDSPDAPAARELRSRILAEREALEDQAAQREEILERATVAPAWSEAQGAGAVAARPGPVAVGMSAAEFHEHHAACFERQAGEYRVVNSGGEPRPAEAWAPLSSEECRARTAAVSGNLVLLADGAVAAIRPPSEAKEVVEERPVRQRVERTAELVELPGGGWGLRGEDGRVEPIPAGAEIRTMDGTLLRPPEPR